MEVSLMTAAIAVLLFVFIIGLCIGSFLNVVILRALSNESIVFPASKCPKCQNPLKWWHNIPVFSYIFLRGKCAFCKAPISIQYPIIELLTGIIFTLLFIKFNLFTLDTLFAWIIAALLIVIAGTDLKEKVVFDVHTYALIGVGIVYALISTKVWDIHSLLQMPIVLSILGALAGALIMEIFARAGYIFVGTRAFGEGDTLIAAGLGAIFGPQKLLWILVLSVVIQVILFLPSFIKGLVQNKDWATLGTFSAFVIYAVGFCAFQSSIPEKLFIIGALILAILGLASCILILKGLREKPENRTYLPYGPAMVIAAFIGLIF